MSLSRFAVPYLQSRAALHAQHSAYIASTTQQASAVLGTSAKHVVLHHHQLKSDFSTFTPLQAAAGSDGRKV
jgi:hypothetical protein